MISRLVFILIDCLLFFSPISFASLFWNSQSHENRSQNGHFQHICMRTNPTESGHFRYIVSLLCRMILYRSLHTKIIPIQWLVMLQFIAQRVQIFVHSALQGSICKIWYKFLFGKSDNMPYLDVSTSTYCSEDQKLGQFSCRMFYLQIMVQLTVTVYWCHLVITPWVF